MDHSIQPLRGPLWHLSTPQMKLAPTSLKDPKIKELADKYGKTSAQIILRYLMSLKEGFCALRSEGFKT